MKSDLDIAFLGGLFPKCTDKEIHEKSKGSVQSAANALQWSIVEGLDQNCHKTVKIFNSLYIGAYPQNYRDLFVKTYSFKHSALAEDINIGFVNLFIIKHLFKYWSIKPHLKKWARDGLQAKLLIGYALSLEFVACLCYAKKINPEVKTFIVVPDLPEFMNTTDKRTLVYRFLKPIETSYILRNINKIDGFVLLTEPMKEALKIKDNYVVVEGIATDSFDRSVPEKDHQTKIILYTGTLNRKYGILNLIEAFKRIPQNNYRLILCGTGDSEEIIKEEALKDSRIIFKGLLSRREILRLQLEATVLVNPRLNNEEYTKYSFPSKILEYLSSGTPVIAYKLDGIPDEYDEYIYYVKDDSVNALRDKLVEICEKDLEEQSSFGEKARRFVQGNKNKQAQTKKIIDLALKE